MKIEREYISTANICLLTEFIELNAEHSRWSSAVTLLISLTVASLIALLGSFNVELFFNETSKFENQSIIVNHVKSTNEYLCNSMAIAKVDSIREYPSSPSTSSERSQLKFSASQILFSCTTLLGLSFTLFFYILRRQLGEKIELTKDEIDGMNRDDYARLVFWTQEYLKYIKESIREKMTEKEKDEIKNEIEEIEEILEIKADVKIIRNLVMKRKMINDNKTIKKFDTEIKGLKDNFIEELNELKKLIKE